MNNQERIFKTVTNILAYGCIMSGLSAFACVLAHQQETLEWRVSLIFVGLLSVYVACAIKYVNNSMS